ncbi:MAG: DUF814 domain-containing protein [Ignavibacteriales bacterium]|nr:DUF814 domain-containing protein [Ignavibacteriales bacterium]
MFKNYFYLLRSIRELNKFILDTEILDCFSQEKNNLFFSIPTNDFPLRHLIISTNPNSPYIFIKNEHHKAKKNVVHFFPEVIHKRINNLTIAENDRIIKIQLENYNIYYSVRGNNTNIFLVNNDEEYSFKKSKFTASEEFNKINFTNDLTLTLPENISNITTNFTELKKQFPMISSEIKNEINFRIDNKAERNILDIFIEIVNEIISDKIKVGFNADLGKVVFIPNRFKSMVLTDFSIFNDYNSALQFYLRSFYKENAKSNYLKDLDKFFDKELSNTANKLNKLSSRVNEGSKEEKYYNKANLLLGNIHKISKGMDEIILENFNNSQKVKITLNPKFGPKENIDKYFEKAKDEKVNYKKSVELYNFTKEKYDSLKEDYDIYKKTNSEVDFERLHKKLIIKKDNIIKMDSGLKFKFWHYIIDDTYHVFVGRDSKSNDYLSVKFAKQNDYWFHARGLPGSHVVIRVDNVKEGIPKDIIKKGASLAAYYSKAKTAGTAPVSYTLAKFVYKKKGMEPGKVFLTKESTLLVKPEIPKNCILIDE